MAMNDDMAMVIFQPSGRRGEVSKGTNIIEASRVLGVDIEALCGEKKVCGKCKVRIEQGAFEKYGITSQASHVSPWQEEEEKHITGEEKALGYRLGCMAKICGDILVFVPEESRAGKQVVSKAARDIDIQHDPAIKKYHLSVSPPAIEDAVADYERLCRALETECGLTNLRIDVLALRQLPTALRQGQWQVTVSVWDDKEILRIQPGKAGPSYGIAIDIGTTTVAGYMCNLETKEVVNTVSLMNPQCKYGEDVMARITYHQTNDDGLKKMSNDIIEGINWLVDEAIRQTHPAKEEQDDEAAEDGYLKLQRDDIEEISLCCNTVMHHILLQLDPGPVGMSPFPPVIHQGMNIKARDLGIHINPTANVFLLPNEAGFVGGDNVGVLLAEEPHENNEAHLIIDIGTNGELVLGNKKRLISTSCATGPALEGAQLQFGMRAAPGAIERIIIDPETHEVDYRVIGRDAWRSASKAKEMQAKGICGSGILDVLAELYKAGVIGKSGKFNKKGQKSKRFRRIKETRSTEFVLAWAEETSIGKDVVITQKDIRQIQLAKGALYAGCKIMKRRLGVDKIDKVKIAGAFGTHIDREKALMIGLFPDCEVEKISSVGNAAGDGARIALLNRQKRQEADWLCRNVEYVELTMEEDFQNQFMEAMQLPHMVDEFPNLTGLVPEEILQQ